MGRPYANEVAELDETFRWSSSASIEQLAGSVVESAGSRLLAVGSGGSLTSAHLAALVHMLFTGNSAQVMTPYELLASPQSIKDAAVLVCSAGGSNPDILSCVDHAANRYPSQLFAITTRPNSKLERLLEARPWTRCHAFQTPVRKDGFLATNSLLATVVLLVRAYERAFGIASSLTESLTDLLHPGIRREVFLESTSEQAAPVVARQTVVVLYGGHTKPAAADFESRFTEAALGCVQLADYRNFAHGRHNWLAQHSESSAVLAISSPQDDQVADRTLALLPKYIPQLKISVQAGVAGVIAAICQSIFLAHVAGVQRQVDPGRPQVPGFGRKLYHLKASPKSVPVEIKLGDRARVAIERKSGFASESLWQRQEVEPWVAAYKEFLLRLKGAKLKAIVFDYDGTLCGPERRLTGPSPQIIAKIKALLNAGVTVGIATGRGKSVREILEKRIRSADHRRHVVVGYHNGAEISTLDDAFCPPVDCPLQSCLQPIASLIRNSLLITRHAGIEAKGSQITLELHGCLNRAALYEEVKRVLAVASVPGVTVVTSTHSIDVLASGISKKLVLQHLESLGIGPSSILCIGDRGRLPGNDAYLLSHPLSLSVDEVSNDPSTCWNLSASDQRFDAATLEILQMISPLRGVARFSIERVKP